MYVQVWRILDCILRRPSLRTWAVSWAWYCLPVSTTQRRHNEY